MRLTIAILLLFSTSQLFSQRSIDTVYLNNNFDKVRKSKATYYRCISKDAAINLYRIMDYHLTGELVKMGVYKDKAARIPIGVVSKFYPNGTVKHEVNYKDGKLTGVVKSYYNNGQTMRLEQYDNYQLISGKYFTPEGKDTTLTPYFRYPSYKEGDIELQKFLQHYKIYPLDALRRGIEGSAMVGLLVKKDGYIGKIGIVSSSNEFFNKEALRVIELTRHNWIPGIDEGEPADIAISVPVVFAIK